MYACKSFFDYLSTEQTKRKPQQQDQIREENSADDERPQSPKQTHQNQNEQVQCRVVLFIKCENSYNCLYVYRPDYTITFRYNLLLVFSVIADNERM